MEKEMEGPPSLRLPGIGGNESDNMSELGGDALPQTTKVTTTDPKLL